MALTAHVHEFPWITRYYLFLMNLCFLLMTIFQNMLTVWFVKHEGQYWQVPRYGDIIVIISFSLFIFYFAVKNNNKKMMQ